MIVPAAFAEPLVARSGDAARRWLADLPTLADDLLRRWSCTTAGPLMHGLTSVVISADRADRSRAVLKLGFAPWCSASERAALHAWGGRGAVRLLEHDDARSAMLLERLCPLARPEPAPFTAAGRIVRLLSVPAPAGLPTIADKVSGWMSDIRAQSERLGHPLSAKVIEAAMRNTDELTDQTTLLVHGDLHFGNLMRGDQGLLAIDPHGLAGDPAYDFLQLLRNDWNAVSAEPDIDRAVERRVAEFADAAELDRHRVRRWAQVRATVSALWLREMDGEQAAIAIVDEVAARFTEVRPRVRTASSTTSASSRRAP